MSHGRRIRPQVRPIGDLSAGGWSGRCHSLFPCTRRKGSPDVTGTRTRTGGFAGIYGSEDAMWWAAIMVSFAGTFRGVGPQKRTVAQAARNPALADPGANASTSSRSLHGTGTARSRVQRIRGPSDFALTGASGHQTGSGRGRSLAWPSASRARAHPASSACCRACRPGGVSWALVDVVRVMAARSVAFPLRESCFVGSARVGDWLTSS